MEAILTHCRNGDIAALRTAAVTAPGGGRKSAVVRKAIAADDYAAFRIAAANGHSDVVRYLIELYGGRRHPRAERARKTNGHAALSLACRAGHADVIRTLIDAYGGWGAPALTEALVNGGALLAASNRAESLRTMCEAAATAPRTAPSLPDLLRRVRARTNTAVAAEALTWPAAWSAGVAQCLTTIAFREEHSRPIRAALRAFPGAVAAAMIAYYERVPWALYDTGTRSDKTEPNTIS